jgi:hypothetical protein
MLNKNNLAKDIENVLNEPLKKDGQDDLHANSDIKKQNKKMAKGIADAIDKYIKEASVDVSGIQMLPGTAVTTMPGQAVASAYPGTTASPGTGNTSAAAELNPATGIDCCKVY